MEKPGNTTASFPLTVCKKGLANFFLSKLVVLSRELNPYTTWDHLTINTAWNGPPDARLIVSMAMRIYGPSDARFIFSMAMGMWQIGLHETDWEYHRQLGQHANFKLEERRLLRIGTSSTGCYPVWCRGTRITHCSNRAWLLTGIFRWSKLV